MILKRKNATINKRRNKITSRFKSNSRKVRDHCHYTGKYRAAAHVFVI